jgi:tetratricopeptide (TPR) repeat protein
MRFSFILSTFIVAGVAMAQEPDPAARFELADRYYRAGEYTEALKGFKELYIETGEAELLYNIGQCQRQLKQYTEAITAYKNYLREVPNSPLQEQVQDLIRLCEEALKGSTSQPAIQPAPKDEPQKSILHFVLFGAAGASGIASAITGVAALKDANEARDLSIVNIGEPAPDPQVVSDLQRSANRSALLSTATTLVAVAAVGGGYLVYQKNKKISVAFSVNGASLQARF